MENVSAELGISFIFAVGKDVNHIDHGSGLIKVAFANSYAITQH